MRVRSDLEPAGKWRFHRLSGTVLSQYRSPSDANPAREVGSISPSSYVHLPIYPSKSTPLEFWRSFEPSILDLISLFLPSKPSTLNPRPSPSTINYQPSILESQPQAPNPETL